MLHSDPSSSRVQSSLPSDPHHASADAATHESFTSRFFRLFSGQERRIAERRRQPRVPSPPLRAYLGVFGSTQPYPVGNISSTGFYLVTPDHWLPGTNMPLRLERTDRPGFAALHCVTVPTRVVRVGPDGVGFAFVLSDLPATPQKPLAQAEGGWLGAHWADRQAIKELVAALEPAPSDRREQA